jgi:hypothetical protein
MQDMIDRAETLYQKIAHTKDATVKLDMMRMHKEAQKLIEQLSTEAVTCRRTKRETDRYKELDAKLEQHLDSMEKYLTFGLIGAK